MKTRAALAVAWIVLILSGYALGQLYHARFTVVGQRQQSDVMLDLFGEFRTVLARYLWFKMDLFHEVLDDEGVDDNQQTEVLPLLRMVSLLDPSMTDSYDVIAWDLYKGHRLSEQALAIIDEGLARNPQSFQLHFRRAIICYQEKRFPQALDSAKQAAAVAQDEFDILNSYRLIYWSAKNTHDRSLALAALDKLIELRPNEERWQTEKAELLSQESKPDSDGSTYSP